MSKKIWLVSGCILAAGIGAWFWTGGDLLEAEAQVPMPQTVDGTFSYAVKFVCGFQKTNSATTSSGLQSPEAIVKLGNYATDINIYNPALDAGRFALIKKRIALLYRAGSGIGREPEQQEAVLLDQIDLRGGFATMDDCTRIYELLGFPPALPPAPPVIGYLVLQSSRELDVTAVYTSEICSDWVQPPTSQTDFMCVNPNRDFGAGISIDVEQIEGRFVVR